ncbi:MAG TPA: hypothetical protein VGG35_01995 [Streptosporangiaceae bacterium]
MPGTFRRPRPPDPATDIFDRLTRLELLVLASRLHDGRRQARLAALRSRSPLVIWDMIRLSQHLADIEYEVGLVLARH